MLLRRRWILRATAHCKEGCQRLSWARRETARRSPNPLNQFGGSLDGESNQHDCVSLPRRAFANGRSRAMSRA